MPGYEPFLLCDFHVHTRWSDGRLSLREVVDLYGKTGRFDVIAITDHILMKKDLLARVARMATLGRRDFSVTEARFEAYLADIAAEAKRARRLYDLLVVPGAEITQNHIRSRTRTSSRWTSRSSSAPISRPRTSCVPSARRARSASPATRITARRGASRSAPAISGITATNWPIWWTCGRRQTVTTSFPSQVSNTFRMWPTATSTSPSTCTRGRPWCGPRRPGRP